MNSRPAPALTRRGLCLVVAAPSGAGKTTLTRALLDADPLLSLSVSMTTRAPRPGEVDGIHYHFRDQATFDALVAAGGFLEHAQVFGRSYGTPRAMVERELAAGRDVLFDIDWQGHRQMRAALLQDVVSVCILPPTFAALEDRLRGRGDPPETIAKRMAEAASEMSHAGEFDYVIVNDDFATALSDLIALLTAARHAVGRQVGLADFLADLSVTKGASHDV